MDLLVLERKANRMHGKIKNAEALLSHGAIESRRIILDVADEVLFRLDAYNQIKKLLFIEGDSLHVGQARFPLSRYEHIYLIGAGKACNHMARAVDEALGDRLTKGIAIVKVLEPIDVFRKTEVFVGGHPLPNAEGFRASQKILELVDRSGDKDLFIVVISGGSSALMSCPLPGISLEDEIKTADLLLKAGAGIYEINAVRRHISALNGGRLAERIQSRGAALIGIGISDGIGVPATKETDKPYANYRGTPMGPDNTTLETARQTVINYDLKEKLPRSVVDYLFSVGPEGETPKAFPQNTYFLLNSVPDSCRIAKAVAAEKGLQSLTLTSCLNGESKDAGLLFSSIAQQIQTYGEPVKAPCLIISAGETYTTIADSRVITGHGGPSQELTAGFSLTAEKCPGAAMFSIDSEGTDGTTPAAGGLTDDSTRPALEKRGINPFEALRTHSTYEALRSVDDAVFTGNTGTNLCDFNLLYVPAPAHKEQDAERK